VDLVEPITELYRRMSCELPGDVAGALEEARRREKKDSPARDALETIIENVHLAREKTRPLCQDTGTPVFYVTRAKAMNEGEIREAILAATREATRRGYLRPNAVDSLSGENSGDNTGVDFPIIHVEEGTTEPLVIDAMLKGGGSENVGARYQLPVASLGASRDLDGARRCVLDAVQRAQGRGCPPYVVGVAVGGARDATAALAKRQLLRAIDDRSPLAALGELEERLLDESNRLGIGPAGLGGATTVLAVKAAAQHRHCACFFVEVAFGCWAMRRGRLIVDESGAHHA